jgi:hypothetical protein
MGNLVCIIVFLIACIVLIPAPHPTPASPNHAQFFDDAIEFNNRWNKFLRTYLGCDKQATDISQCSVNLGQMDYQEFLSARKAAMKLFDLQSRTNK